MTKSRRAYSAEDVAKIIEMRTAHMPEKEIAVALGRSYNSLHSKLKELRDEGLVPVIRDISPITDEDIAKLAESRGVTVGLVTDIMARLGSLYRGKLPRLEEVVDAYISQQGRCCYFGTMMDITYNSEVSNRAELVYTGSGDPMWMTRMAKRMRGRLSHTTFLRAVEIIYKHRFTSGT